MNSNPKHKIVVVAGGTGGLGRAVSLAFLNTGAEVVVTYRNEEEYIALKTAAGDHSSFLSGQTVNVADEVAVSRFVASLVAAHGSIDVLVNAIGGYAGGIKLWEMDPKAFHQLLDVNLHTGYALARAVVPVMLKQGKGAIVNVVAKAALDHAAGAGAYAASKAGALAMFDSLAEDLRGTGIRVNSVLPSIIDTNANRRAMPHADFAKWPKPEDIAQVILFLSSDDAKVIHGAAIPVYGAS